jgi:tetratricopeptide (TPR) repeat protein
MTSPNQVDADFQRAVGLFNSGKPADAEHILTPIAAAYPDNGMVWFVLGMTQGSQGRPLDAMAALRKAATLNVNQPALLPTLAGLLVNAGWTEEGVARYRAALAAAPANLKLVGPLATALMIHGALDEALALFNQVRGADPRNALAAGNAAQILATLGQDDAAAQTLATAIALDPQAEIFRLWMADINLLSTLRRWIDAEGARILQPRESADPYVPLIQSTLSTSSQTAVVYFHVTQNAPHPIQSLQDGQTVDYLDILALSARTAKQRMPRSRTILLTDNDTRLPETLGIDAVVRLPLQRAWIMYERMRAQRALVASGCVGGPVLFLDTDIIVQRDFAPVFAQDFDVGLTWRVQPLMPLNGGMILGTHGASANLLRFFDICLAAYDGMTALPAVRERYPFDIREFQGDQLALAAFPRWRVPIGRPAFATIDGVRAAFFPADDFNASFSPTLDPAVLQGKFAVHFKGGKAKSFAAAFAARTPS